MSKSKWFLLPLLAAILILPTTASAAAFSINLAFDENGNGLFTNTNGFSQALPSSLVNDPGPGGLNNVLFYGMLNPPGLVAGDLVITDGGETLSDILRFDSVTQGGGIFVYSDADDSDLADVGFPGVLSQNNLFVTEIGVEGNNGFTYTPTAGQPGFVTGAGGPITYAFTSDTTTTPEPGSLFLLIAGGAGLGVFTRFRNVARAR